MHLLRIGARAAENTVRYLAYHALWRLHQTSSRRFVQRRLTLLASATTRTSRPPLLFHFLDLVSGWYITVFTSDVELRSITSYLCSRHRPPEIFDIRALS